MSVPGGVAAPIDGGCPLAVKAGDTFYSLEAANNWPMGVLARLNPDVSDNVLKPGQVLNGPC